jgi:hypothetical protein
MRYLDPPACPPIKEPSIWGPNPQVKFVRTDTGEEIKKKQEL